MNANPPKVRNVSTLDANSASVTHSLTRLACPGASAPTASFATESLTSNRLVQSAPAAIDDLPATYWLGLDRTLKLVARLGLLERGHELTTQDADVRRDDETPLPEHGVTYDFCSTVDAAEQRPPGHDNVVKEERADRAAVQSLCEAGRLLV